MDNPVNAVPLINRGGQFSCRQGVSFWCRLTGETSNRGCPWVRLASSSRTKPRRTPPNHTTKSAPSRTRRIARHGAGRGRVARMVWRGAALHPRWRGWGTARYLRAACSAFTASRLRARRSRAPWRPLTRLRRRTRRPRRATERRTKCPGLCRGAWPARWDGSDGGGAWRRVGWIQGSGRAATERRGGVKASRRRRRGHCCADRDGGILLAGRHDNFGKSALNNELRKCIRCRRRSFAPVKLPMRP